MRGKKDLILTIGGYYSSYILLGMTVSAIGPLLPTFVEKYALPLSALSIIFPAQWVGNNLASLVVSRAYDRIAGHRVLLAVLALAGGLVALIPFASTLWLLMGVFLLLGIALGTIDVGGNTLLMWKLGERARPYMNALHFFFGFGSIIGPILVAWVASWSGDPTRACWLIALTALLPILLVIITQSPPNPAAQHKSDAAAPVSSNSSGWLTLALAVFFFLHTGAELGFGNYIYSYTHSIGLTSGYTATLLNSAYWAAITFGRLLAVPVSTRLSTRRILHFSLVGAVLSAGVILVANRSAAALWAGTVGLGLFIAALYPGSMSYAGERITISGRATGYLVTGSNLGAMALPWLIGQFFDRSGALSTMTITAAALLAALVLFTFIARNAALQRKNHPTI